MRTLKLYLPAALVSGLIVFAVLNVAAWYNLRGATNVCRRQDKTRLTLRFVARELAALQGELPARPADIPEALGFHNHPEALLFDAWDNPIQYSVTDGSFSLFSFGRDGKEGGAGLDADLYHDGRNREASLATFQQFFTERDSGEVDTSGFVFAGILAGGIVAFAVLGTARGLQREGKSLTDIELLVSVVIVTVLACVVGVFLLPFHIPTGH